jgi:16S rRNA processing protein RimM
VRAARGIRGELTVAALTDFPQRFQPGATVWASGASYTVRRARAHRRALLLELEGIDTRDQAETLRGLLLEVPVKELPPLAEDQYYRFQILGMDVVDREDRPLGRVEEVLETGANDVYIVRGPDGELLLPAIDAVVKEVDVAAKRMVVELLEGLELRHSKRPRRP